MNVWLGAKNSGKTEEIINRLIAEPESICVVSDGARKNAMINRIRQRVGSDNVFDFAMRIKVADAPPYTFLSDKKVYIDEVDDVLRRLYGGEIVMCTSSELNFSFNPELGPVNMNTFSTGNFSLMPPVPPAANFSVTSFPQGL